MPTYRVQAPDGRTVQIEGDTEPTDAELDEIFVSLKGSPTREFTPAAEPAPTEPGAPADAPPTGPDILRPASRWELPILPEAVLHAARVGTPVLGAALEKLTPLALGEAAPGIAATIGALATAPASIPAALLAAGIGGAAGLGGKRVAQAGAGVPITDQSVAGRMLAPQGIPTSFAGDIQELVGEAAKQAAFEGVGQLGGLALKKYAGPAPIDRIGQLAEEIGVPTDPTGIVEKLARRTIAGRQITERAGKQAEKEALGRAEKEAAELGVGPAIPGEAPGSYARRAAKEFEAARTAALRADYAAERQQVMEGVQWGLTTAEAEVKTLLEKIAPGVRVYSPRSAGLAAEKGTRQGLRLAKKEASRLYEAADQANSSTMVDFSAHIDDLKQLAEEMELAPTQDPGTLVAYARKLAQIAGGPVEAKVIQALSVPADQMPGALVKAFEEIGMGSLAKLGTAPRGQEGAAVMDLIREAAGQPGGPVSAPLSAAEGLQVSYKQARELQKWLGQRLEGARYADDIPTGRLKKAWGSVSDAINGSLQGPGASAFREATQFYKDFMKIADRGAAGKVVNAFANSPEDVLKLMERGPTRILEMRRAIVGYAERYGSKKEQKLAKQTWDQLTHNYAQKKLLMGKNGVADLPAKLRAVDDDTLRALYGNDGAKRWREIGATIEKLKGTKVSPVRKPTDLGVTPAERTALDNLQDLEASLKLMDTAGSGMGMGLLHAGGGIGWLLGSKAFFGATLSAEAAGGLVTWAATNRLRTRQLLEAAGEGFRFGAPQVTRLVDAYLADQRDRRLLEGEPMPPPPIPAAPSAPAPPPPGAFPGMTP